MPRVLVVEDDFFVSWQAEEALADAGFAVVGVAVTADEAIRIAAAERPDMIVMDIRLSGARDGIEAALDILRQCGIRCLFATAHDDAATRSRAALAEPAGWLPKPYTMEALVDALRRALGQQGGGGLN